MEQSSYKIVHYFEKELGDGRKPDCNGFYRFSKNEVAKAVGLSERTVSQADKVFNVKISFCGNNRGWSNAKQDYVEMISDFDYKNGVYSFRRNPESEIPELDYYWAPKVKDPYFTWKSYDEKHRRRTNSENAYDGTYPWSWKEEQIIKYRAKHGERG